MHVFLRFLYERRVGAVSLIEPRRAYTVLDILFCAHSFRHFVCYRQVCAQHSSADIVFRLLGPIFSVFLSAGATRYTEQGEI